ncbi:MAG: VanZ family protein [Gammaproteobacteria bacterium]|nr:VanZ family protein [Gammaproteobacteria bacterium]
MLNAKRRVPVLSDWTALLWGVAIGYLSLSPAPALPTLSNNDKLEHFAAYCVLGFLGTLSRRSKYSTFSMLIAIIAYGGAIEVVQHYVDRHMELGDFIANTCGALLGATIVTISNSIAIRNP